MVIGGCYVLESHEVCLSGGVFAVLLPAKNQTGEIRDMDEDEERHTRGTLRLFILFAVPSFVDLASTVFVCITCL